MKKILTTILIVISLNAAAQERMALVIGNSDYSINPLSNTLNDAQDIAKSLEDLDFQVTLVILFSRKWNNFPFVTLK